MQTLGTETDSPSGNGKKRNSVASVPAETRFTTVQDSYFNKSRMTQKTTPSLDIETLKSHFKFHKGTTYSIGARGESYDNKLKSLTKDTFIGSPSKKDGNLPGRRNQDQNINLVKSYEIGANNICVKGSENKGFNNRSNSTYNQTLKGATIGNQFSEASMINKNISQYMQRNKFEYGLDQNGGIKAFRTMNNSHHQSPNNLSKFREMEKNDNKERIERQNFKIQPNKPLDNSKTVKIGDNIHRFVKNEID